MVALIAAAASGLFAFSSIFWASIARRAAARAEDKAMCAKWSAETVRRIALEIAKGEA
jgi:hypothetical protein